jgi:hypothetical protein
MAELIPPLSSCLRRMQAGEKRFARRLGTHLEDDYLCWYEPAIGPRPRYTDFVILHPLRGLLCLEVKDWKLDTIRRACPDHFELLTANGLKNVPNPLQQARQCTYQLTKQLERDPQLIQTHGPHRGKLILPYGFGVVLTNITRAQFENAGLAAVLPQVQTLCKDEMLESAEAEEFQKHLWDMFNYCFNRVLTQPQIDRIRWHLFPEIRMAPQPELRLGDQASDRELAIPDLVKVMDIKQEKLARGLGAGHRVIHGVAGSGKTMILGYRCLHLARLLNKPVLVLCYNVALAARLQALIEEREQHDRINVYSIHRWASTVLRTYNIPVPALTDGNFDAAIEALIEQVAKGHIPRGQYGAVLVDEGHDFKKEWLQLVVDMVDPDTNSLLLLYDDTQSLYKSGTRLGFSLKEVGIEAQGRTTILKLNYRNTREILDFAFDFVDDYVTPTDGSEDTMPVVSPDTAGRKGPLPAVRQFGNFEQEARYIAAVFAKLHQDRGIAWADMCVLHSRNWMGGLVAEAMTDAGVPCRWLKDTQSKRQLRLAEQTVKILSMHSSKGLEFPTVANCGIGSLGCTEERIQVEAKLLYVAMTRATENLLLTSSGESPFSTKLRVMAEKHRAAANEVEPVS